MLTNCDVIVIFPVYNQFGANSEAGLWEYSLKTYISLKIIFYLTQTGNRSKKSLTQLSHHCLE